MPHPSLVPAGEAVFDIDLLRTLRGRHLSSELKVLCVIGAHRFDELQLINRLFPGLRHIYLFEPQEAPLADLNRLAEQDSRIRVFPFAVSDTDGVASFNVASNNGESSSLLKLGSHRELFPEVTMQTVIQVQTRRLDTVLTEQGLPRPDLMIVDVQGAEYLVLKSFSPAVLGSLRLLYTEVSTQALYESAGLLSDVEALLSSRFINLGFAPMRADVPMHGNAVFVARADADAALALTLGERLRRAFHGFKRRVRGQPAAGSLA
jgi:FkbM family methyltransferase